MKLHMGPGIGGVVRLIVVSLILGLMVVACTSARAETVDSDSDEVVVNVITGGTPTVPTTTTPAPTATLAPGTTPAPSMAAIRSLPVTGSSPDRGTGQGTMELVAAGAIVLLLGSLLVGARRRH